MEQVFDYVRNAFGLNQTTNELNTQKTRFLSNNAKEYGYNGQIDVIVEQEFKRLKGKKKNQKKCGFGIHSNDQDQIYLDHAGSTLYSEKMLDEIMLSLKSNLFANPRKMSNLRNKNSFYY